MQPLNTKNSFIDPRTGNRIPLDQQSKYIPVKLPPNLQAGVDELQLTLKNNDVPNAIKMVKKHPARLSRLASQLNAYHFNRLIRKALTTVNNPTLLKNAIGTFQPATEQNLLREWVGDTVEGANWTNENTLVRPSNFSLNEQGKALMAYSKSRLPEQANLPYAQGKLNAPKFLEALSLLAPSGRNRFKTYLLNAVDHTHNNTLYKVENKVIGAEKTRILNGFFKDSELGEPFGAEITVNLDTGDYIQKSYEKNLNNKKEPSLISPTPDRNNPFDFMGQEIPFTLVNIYPQNTSKNKKTDSQMLIDGVPKQNFSNGLNAKQVKALNLILSNFVQGWPEKGSLGVKWVNEQLKGK